MGEVLKVGDGEPEQHDDEGDDDETNTMQKFVAASSRILDRWEDSQTEEVRQAAIDRFVTNGDGDATEAGLDELEGAVLVTAYTHNVEAEVCQPYGLTMDTFLSHVAEADEHLFRQAVVNGNWGWLRSWAKSIAHHRAQKRT